MITVETKSGPQVITRNQVVGYLIAIWATCVLAAAGVSWIAASVTADHANQALAAIVKLQRQQGHDGLALIYQDSKLRCEDGVAARNVLITNAKTQEQFYQYLYAHRSDAPQLLSHVPKLTIPPAVRPCAKSVQDPNKTGNHLVLKPPVTAVG